MAWVRSKEGLSHTQGWVHPSIPEQAPLASDLAAHASARRGPPQSARARRGPCTLAPQLPWCTSCLFAHILQQPTSTLFMPVLSPAIECSILALTAQTAVPAGHAASLVLQVPKSVTRGPTGASTVVPSLHLRRGEEARGGGVLLALPGPHSHRAGRQHQRAQGGGRGPSPRRSHLRRILLRPVWSCPKPWASTF